MKPEEFKKFGLKSGEHINVMGRNGWETNGVYVRCSKGIVYIDDSFGSQLSIELDYIKEILKRKLRPRKKKDDNQDILDILDKNIKGSKKKEKKEYVTVKGRMAYIDKQPLGIAYPINEEEKKEDIKNKINKWNASVRRRKDKACADMLKNAWDTTSSYCSNEEKPIKSFNTLEVGDEVKAAYHLRIVHKHIDPEYGLTYTVISAKEGGYRGYIYRTPQQLEEQRFIICDNKDVIIDEMIEYFENEMHGWEELGVDGAELIIKYNKFITYLKELKNEHK